MSERSYGLCPAQLEGITTDGRPFYFRSRHESWTLRVGESGWIPNYCAWPTRGILVAHDPEYECDDPDAIDALVDQHLGAGWRHATWEEQLFDRQCLQCHKDFRSDGSNICLNCLHNMLQGNA